MEKVYVAVVLVERMKVCGRTLIDPIIDNGFVGVYSTLEKGIDACCDRLSECGIDIAGAVSVTQHTSGSATIEPNVSAFTDEEMDKLDYALETFGIEKIDRINDSVSFYVKYCCVE